VGAVSESCAGEAREGGATREPDPEPQRAASEPHRALSVVRVFLHSYIL
jgi:hypothetical protein